MRRPCATKANDCNLTGAIVTAHRNVCIDHIGIATGPRNHREDAHGMFTGAVHRRLCRICLVRFIAHDEQGEHHARRGRTHAVTLTADRTGDISATDVV